MITVLYIPFDEETDLIESAIDWCNNKKGFSDLIIVRHGEDKFQLPSNMALKIYILGHGLCGEALKKGFTHHICSGSDLDKFTILSIEEIANRFTQDFLFYMPKIVETKLYFCNLTGTEEYIATLFQKSLSLSQCFDMGLSYYSGTLYEPHCLNGKKYSVNAEGVPALSSTKRKRLVKIHVENDDKENQNSNVQQEDLPHSNKFFSTISSVQQRRLRISNFIENNKLNRAATVSLKRGMEVK